MTDKTDIADARLNRRRLVWITMVIPSLAFALLAWTAFDARVAAKDSAASSRGSAEAVSQLAEILNRRAPMLEYLGCHDRAADAVDLAYNDLVNALLDVDTAVDHGDQASTDRTRALAATALTAYNEAGDRLQASTDPSAPELPPGKTIDDGPYRCPALPIP